MRIITADRKQIESVPLPTDAAIISFADSAEQLAKLPDGAPALQIICDDAAEDYGQVRSPNIDQARSILDFVKQHAEREYLICQCEKGIGRSRATAAAIGRLSGGNPSIFLEPCTHNRKLYALLCAAGGKPLPAEPLVSMVVRCKYAPTRLAGFILAMQRQRHENWELIAVTDGEQWNWNAEADSRIKIISTDQAKGRWGHPYRQLGIDLARGEFLGLSNDDNYYVPGYFERMLLALTDDVDLAYCDTVHSYLGWDVQQPAGPKRGQVDLGGFLVRRSLTDQVKFTGMDWEADGRYVEDLAAISRKSVHVPYPLFVHN